MDIEYQTIHGAKKRILFNALGNYFAELELIRQSLASIQISERGRGLMRIRAEKIISERIPRAHRELEQFMLEEEEMAIKVEGASAEKHPLIYCGNCFASQPADLLVCFHCGKRNIKKIDNSQGPVLHMEKALSEVRA